jgi:hypothetical protein
MKENLPKGRRHDGETCCCIDCCIYRKKKAATPFANAGDGMKSIMRKLAAKKSQATGKMGEALCEIALRNAGYKMIERVRPATMVIKGKMVYLTQCSGDFRAVGPGGKSVLVECKYRERNLRPSDFQAHQIKSLNDHFLSQGISIVAHVDQHGCRLIMWRAIMGDLSYLTKWEP